MPSYEQLSATLDEIEVSLNFTAASTALRPRLNGILKWDSNDAALNLARQFMGFKPVFENIYGALLVRVVAAFERFARILVSDAAVRMAASSKTYAEMTEHVRNRHAVLTGRLLSTLEEPFDYQTVDVRQLVQNLASCVSDSQPFRLNGSAFAAVISSGKPGIIQRALENLDIAEWWDDVSKSENLHRVLGTRNVRETTKATIKRLDELCKTRNRIAHGGDGDVMITEAELRQEILFVRALAEALSREVSRRLR
jgi:hypothetical protein